MLARALVAVFSLILPAGAAHSQAQLVIGAVVTKRVQLSLQGDRLEVRSNSREGVRLSFGTTTIVVPGGVQVLDLRALRVPSDAPLQVTALPL